MNLRIAKIVTGEIVIGQFQQDGYIDKCLEIKMSINQSGDGIQIGFSPLFGNLAPVPVSIDMDKTVYCTDPDSQLTTAYLQIISGIVTPTPEEKSIILQKK